MATEEQMIGIIEAIIEQDENRVSSLVEDGISSGIRPLDIINNGLTVGLKKVGDLFAEEILFLPELVQCGQIVTNVMSTLESQLKGDKSATKKGKCIIATVKGDVHDIGKNLVALILKASGYDVIDIGKDVSAEFIVEKISELKPDIVALSALLSTTMPGQKDSIRAIEEAGLRGKVKIIVGGAPVTRTWAEEIGADGYAEDASTAVYEADRMLGLVDH